MGRIRVSHQSDPVTRFGFDDLRSVFSSDLCCLFNPLHNWDHSLDANTFCGISTCSDVRTHASICQSFDT